jgi:hypothetical protein
MGRVSGSTIVDLGASWVVDLGAGWLVGSGVRVSSGADSGTSWLVDSRIDWIVDLRINWSPESRTDWSADFRADWPAESRIDCTVARGINRLAELEVDRGRYSSCTRRILTGHLWLALVWPGRWHRLHRRSLSSVASNPEGSLLVLLAALLELEV